MSLESVVVAQTAVELAGGTSSTVVCDWLLRFRCELITRHSCNPHIVPFSEELREYIKRVAPHKESGLVAT
jgi:hypothetical protein